MKKKVLIILALLLLCLFGFKLVRSFVDKRVPNIKEDTELFVYPNTAPGEVLDSLCAHSKRVGSMKRIFSKFKVSENIKPGHYLVKDGASSAYVARMLNNGWQSPVNLVLSGSLRKKGEIARKISRQMMMDSSTVAKALDDKDLLAIYGVTPQTVFSLFMPDTYEMYWTDSIKTVLDKQKAAQDAFWTDSNLAKARKVGLNKMQVSILASIVKGESRYEPELPKIAGVYLNRLNKGMKLQADPTVAYCYDYTLNRILKKHLTIDNPYNTYMYHGLPPGPINVPDRKYLEAVLNPDYGDGNLFFCADPSFNGSHRFAKNWLQHEANARAFHKALTERNKAKK